MLVVSNLALTDAHRAAVREVDQGLRLAVVDGAAADPYGVHLQEMEVAFCARTMPASVLSTAPRLRWVHTTAAGVDGVEATGLLNPRFELTLSNGVHALPMAEHVLWAMLSLARQGPAMLRAQRDHCWLKDPAHPLASELHGQTLGVISLGAIGTECGRRAKQFGMRVIGTRRTATAGNPPDWVDELVLLTRPDRLLSESDFLLLAVPLTAVTRGLIGATQLARMKLGSFLINISRGELVDDAALIEALASGHLGGAALDVFATEPLPASSPFWDLPNVIVTPHASGSSNRQIDRCVDLFCENLGRYLTGRELLNRYDREHDY